MPANILADTATIYGLVYFDQVNSGPPPWRLEVSAFTISDS
jgi:hypothetical protein